MNEWINELEKHGTQFVDQSTSHQIIQVSN